jgi:hypothetical protein
MLFGALFLALIFPVFCQLFGFEICLKYELPETGSRDQKREKKAAWFEHEKSSIGSVVEHLMSKGCRYFEMF